MTSHRGMTPRLLKKDFSKSNRMVLHGLCFTKCNEILLELARDPRITNGIQQSEEGLRLVVNDACLNAGVYYSQWMLGLKRDTYTTHNGCWG